MNDAGKLIKQCLNERLTETQAAWLKQAIEGLAEKKGLENRLLTYTAAAGRRLGAASLGTESSEIPTSAGNMPIVHWSLAEAGRVLLLLEASACHPEQEADLLEAIFRQGDDAEIGAAIRGLILFPSAERLKFHALETGRTNNKALYSCLLEQNPYPAAYYSDHEFNQLVLKALFLGLPIVCVHGLNVRANAELARMCEDYIDERLAAGRSIPADIWLALAPHAGSHGLELLNLYLDGEDPEHRHYAALALQVRMAKVQTP